MPACSKDPSKPWLKLQNELKEGIELPGEIYGGSPNFDIAVIYSVYRNGELIHYVLDGEYPKFYWVEINPGQVEGEKPFFLYIDRHESWTVLKEIYASIEQYNSDYFYVASHTRDASESDDYLGIEIKDPENVESPVLATVLADGSLDNGTDALLCRSFSGVRVFRVQACFLLGLM